MVTAYTPSDGSGRALRTTGVARALARLDEVQIAYIEFDGDLPAAQLSSDPHVILRRLEASFGVRRLGTYARARFARMPHDYARGVSPELVGAVGRAESYERIVADGPIAAAALLLVAHAPNVYYCAHNVESLLAAQTSDAPAPRGLNRLRDFESRLFTRARETWLPTDRDVRDARAIVRDARYRHVPNVIDVDAISPVSPGSTGRVLFVADFSYDPNQRAAEFLVVEVMPRLWEVKPDTRLALVGRSLRLPVDNDARIETLGFVDDLASEYARADCAVVPLMRAGGSQLKFVEALAYGLPVVASGVAGDRLEGGSAGVHFLQADSAAEFAASLVEVLDGGKPDLGRRGRALVESTYSIDALAASLAAGAEADP